MRRTEVMQEIRKMRFEEAYEGWSQNWLTQEEAAQLLGVSDRTFRRYLCRYEKKGLDALTDKRISQVSHRRAPVDELIADFSTEHFVAKNPWRVIEKSLLLKKSKTALHRAALNRAATVRERHCAITFS
ncbi:MAG TPA: helix-turn-helix domain-containing protein [Gammaproteobacteria bacterium]|nr:helix-turn-helix domain-containing protein [Gammaproteobacteria bacterium]